MRRNWCNKNTSRKCKPTKKHSRNRSKKTQYKKKEKAIERKDRVLELLRIKAAAEAEKEVETAKKAAEAAWMSQEVRKKISKWVITPIYPVYKQVVTHFANHLLTSWDIQVLWKMYKNRIHVLNV